MTNKIFGKKILSFVLLSMAFVCCTLFFSCTSSNEKVIEKTTEELKPEATEEVGFPEEDALPTIEIAEQTPEATALPEEKILKFSDPYFEAAVRENLDKPLGNIYYSDVCEITTLTMRVCGIRNLEGIENFTALESLDVYGNKICDISPLAACKNLKKINLRGNYTAIYDTQSRTGLSLEPLSGLTELVYLDVSDNGVYDITPLAKLSKLESLDISKNRIRNAETLGELTALKYLNISENCDIEEIDGVDTYVGIKDISFAGKLKNLETFDCSYCLIDDIEVLKKLKNLKNLDIRGNDITDISVIDTMEQLENVNRGGNDEF